MTVSIEKKEYAIAGAGALGAYGVGKSCELGVKTLYHPIIEYVTSLQKELNEVEILTRTMADSGSSIAHTGAAAQSIFKGAQRMAASSSLSSRIINQLQKATLASQQAGGQSALWSGTFEAALNFFRSWKSKESRPLVTDIMEGGLRGSIIGMGSTAFRLNESTQAVQMVTGAWVGFVAGMIGAGVGSLSGYIMKKIL